MKSTISLEKTLEGSMVRHRTRKSSTDICSAFGFGADYPVSGSGLRVSGFGVGFQTGSRVLGLASCGLGLGPGVRAPKILDDQDFSV